MSESQELELMEKYLQDGSAAYIFVAVEGEKIVGCKIFGKPEDTKKMIEY